MQHNADDEEAASVPTRTSNNARMPTYEQVMAQPLSNFNILRHTLLAGAGPESGCPSMDIAPHMPYGNAHMPAGDDRDSVARNQPTD